MCDIVEFICVMEDEVMFDEDVARRASSFLSGAFVAFEAYTRGIGSCLFIVMGFM